MKSMLDKTCIKCNKKFRNRASDYCSKECAVSK